MPNKKARSFNRQVRATAVPPPGDRSIAGSKNPNGVSIRGTAKDVGLQPYNSTRTGAWKTAATWGAMQGRLNRSRRRA